MFDNLLIIARCDVWCGTGQACGGEMEGGEGRGRGEQGLWAEMAESAY